MHTPILIKNECSADKIPEAFQPLIQASLAAYEGIFGEAILSIRLQGSVARGEAKPDSDIDFIAVLRQKPTAEQLVEVSRQEERLQQAFPLVKKVDLQTVTEETMVPFRRFIFAIDSLCLRGPDPYSMPELWISGEELAIMVTPDQEELVQSYRKAVEKTGEDDTERLKFYSRIIGKDLLKCYRRLVLLNGGPYERNVDKIYRQLVQFVPQQASHFGELKDLYTNPASDRRRLLRVLGQIWYPEP